MFVDPFNAVGFVLMGLLGWRLAPQPMRLQPQAIPFSHLYGSGLIGARFFEENDLIDEDKPTPTGIVDNLDDYQRPDLDTSDISARIRAFYEHTNRHDLFVYPEWHGAFKLAAPMYKRLSAAIGQMNFPMESATDETEIFSCIVPVSDQKDGRNQVRGWVRTYARTNKAVYIAAYSSHQRDGIRYMNIAFPLPFSNLTSILHLNEMGHGLSLTSFNSKLTEYQGVYLVTRFLTVRLPINEIIEVFPADTPYDHLPIEAKPNSFFATHRMWFFRMKFLTLHYMICEQYGSPPEEPVS